MTIRRRSSPERRSKTTLIRELPAGDDAGEGAARVRGGAAHRRGRSMTVRATVPASLAEASTYDSAEGVTGSHARSTVFVPTRGLSKQYRDRIVTFRVFLFILVLAGLGGGVVGVVTWFRELRLLRGLVRRPCEYLPRKAGWPALVQAPVARDERCHHQQPAPELGHGGATGNRRVVVRSSKARGE